MTQNAQNFHPNDPNNPYQANPAAGTDIVPFVIPGEDDYDLSGGGDGGAKIHWRTGGSKPDYPGVHDFIFRPLPVPQGRRPKVRIAKHLYQLPNGAWFSHLCPIAMKVPGGRCFSCEAAQQMLTNNPLDADIAKKMSPQDNILFNVILRSDPDRGPVVHEAHWSFDKTYASASSQGVNLFDPSPNGVDSTVHVPIKKGSGERWAYAYQLQRKPLHHDPAQVQDWVSRAHNLDVLSTCMSYEDQYNAYCKALNKQAAAQAAPPVYAPPMQQVQQQRPALGPPMGYQQPGYAAQPPQMQPGYQQPRPAQATVINAPPMPQVQQQPPRRGPA